MLSQPCRQDIWSGPTPDLSYKLTSALLLSRNCTMHSCPFSHAVIRGLNPNTYLCLLYFAAKYQLLFHGCTDKQQKEDLFCLLHKMLVLLLSSIKF